MAPVTTVMQRAAKKLKLLLRDENEVILAVIALGLAIQEVVFGVLPEWLPIVEWLQCGVLFLLFMEWCASLYLSEDRMAHLQDPRTFGGVAILVVCLLAFSPAVAHILVQSPALRILRIAPALFFGFLTTRPLFASRGEPEEIIEAEQVAFRRLEAQSNENISFAPISREEFEAWVADSEREGCRCAIAENAGAVLGNLAIPSVTATMTHSALAAGGYPRISRLGATFVFAGSLPMLRGAETLDVQMVPFAFLCGSKSCLLMESHPSIGITLSQFLKEKRLLLEHPLHFRLAIGLFSLLIARYEEAADRLATEVRHLMMLPMGRDGDKAYKAAFTLQKSLARMKADVWRLGQIFDRLENGRLTLPFGDESFQAIYESFSDACDYVMEAFSQSHDAASSTIDLRINLASFQMNRFMGLLAVATAVGIIPATLSGFLGMNVQGTNFPVTLGNVAFWAVMLVVLALYFLKTRGWLKF